MSTTRHSLWLALSIAAALVFYVTGHAQHKRGISLERSDHSVRSPLAGGVYRALIIGNQDYLDPSGHWQSLETPLEDARAMQRVLRDLYAALRPGGALFCSNPRGGGEEGWQGQRYGVWHDVEQWSAFVSAAGCVELDHYSRPPGRPRDQQPWLASVWRRP